MRILIDINIILDVLEQREPFFQRSAQIWSAMENNQFEGIVPAHTITTLFYLIRKQLGSQQATVILTQILTVLSIVPVDQTIIQQALAWGWQDFEDAVQMSAALNANATAIVTRNVADFRDHHIPVWKPIQLLALLAK